MITNKPAFDRESRVLDDLSLCGSFHLCPYCFHASFIAKEALRKSLENRRSLH